ncbi:surface protease GP63, putative, partial [Trypanosoma cruzi marinkellei]
VKAKTQAHFDCNSLEGMELEDEDGASARKVPHWKERHARDELMAPTVGAGYYTALTMAVFADMGYYRVNWSMAEPMSWGNRSGCDFLQKKCNETNDFSTKYPHVFCDANDNETLRCTSDRRHVGTCTASIVENKGTPADKDVCPVVSSYFYEASSGMKYNTCSEKNVTLPGSLTGGNSWCLDAELVATEDKSKPKSVKGVCAQVLCEEGTVKVKYRGGDFQLCHEEVNITVKLDGFNEGGKIRCPKYGEVCTIAANGSSLVIPSVLEDDKRDNEREEHEGEASVVAPALSPAAEALTKASPADLPAAEYSSTEGPRAEASPAGENSEAPVVQVALQQPQQESEAEQMTAVEAPATYTAS